MADLNDITWCTAYPRMDVIGHNDPYGRTDNYNAAMKIIYAVMGAEHTDAGVHKTVGLLKHESLSYTGDGNATHVVALTDTTLIIKFLLIFPRTAVSPCLTSVTMGANNTKIFDTAAFQANVIKAISVTGQFSVGSHASVNTLNDVYDYIAIGV